MCQRLTRPWLFFGVSTTFEISAFFDFDWASCPTTWWLMIGFAIYLDTSLISWELKKQHIVAQSSIEVEYRALAYSTYVILWLTNLLTKLHEHTSTTCLFTNSSSTVAITRNPILHQQTKHNEIDIHVVRDHVLAKEIIIRKVHISLNVTNLFTKPAIESLINTL